VETPGLAAHKKNAARLGAHLACLDESGFLLIPPVRRTWGPCGQTPLTKYSYKHDKISAISALTVSPQRRRIGLYFQLHRKNIQQAEVCQFVRYLLRHLRGHLIGIWDNGKPHKGEPLRNLCRQYPRLHLERFPAYAPELNPDEGVWSQADNALANGRPDDLDELSVALHHTLRHLRRSQAKLRWCVHQSELPPLFTLTIALFMQISIARFLTWKLASLTTRFTAAYRANGSTEVYLDCRSAWL
jgi:transposase